MMICLSSCSMASTNYVAIGLPVKEYSKEKQLKVYNELKTCPCTEVKEMIKDGYVLRQGARELNLTLGHDK